MPATASPAPGPNRRPDSSEAVLGKGALLRLMAALLTASIAFQFSASMIAPVLATMAQDLKTDDAAVGFSQTTFFTAAAIFAIVLPKLGDTVGHRKVLAWVLALTVLGSLLAVLAPTIEVLCIARGLQGFSGPVVPLCLIVLRRSVRDPIRYGTLMGVLVAVNGGVAGIDALLGGYLATHGGFRAVFAVIAATAVIATVAVASLQRPVETPDPAPMDWSGAAALAATLALLLTGVNQAGELGAANWLLVGVLLAAGAVCFGLFLGIERRTAHPMVTPAELRQRRVWALLLTTTLTLAGIYAAVTGIAVGLAQDTKAGFGATPSAASCALLVPFALIGWIMAPFTGRLAPLLGYRMMLRVGLAGSTAAVLLMALAGVHSYGALVAGVTLAGIFYSGIANVMLNGISIVASRPDNLGFLPGVNSAAFHLGAALSFALLPAVRLSSTTAPTSGSGYSAALLLGCVLTALAFLTSLLIPDTSAAETPHHDTPVQAGEHA